MPVVVNVLNPSVRVGFVSVPKLAFGFPDASADQTLTL